MKNLLFVYGTLRKGESRNEVLSQSLFKGNGVLYSHKLYDLGSFPGIKSVPEKERYVFGELYEIDTYTLNKIDHIEGYDPDYPEYSLFVRQEVSVRLSSGDFVNAYTYYFNGDTKDSKVIESGDYTRYKLDKVQLK